MNAAQKLAPQTNLERAVARWLNSEAKDNESDIVSLLKDLQQGCQSGIVGHLIYHKDTVRFYKRHRKEIDALLAENMESSGEYDLGTLFTNWDNTDPLAREDANQNILAWFGFEETASILAARAGIEI